MDIDALEWLGAGLSLLAVFLFSMFHIALSESSKISISRLMDDKDKGYRARILDRFDELNLAVEFFRNLFLIAFMIYLFVVFPRLQLWPLWYFLIGLGTYLVFIDWIPRLICLFYKRQILLGFLPSYNLLLILSRPVFIFSRLEREEPEDEDHEASEEEIDALIEEAHEEGLIEEEEGILLKSVVEFGDTIVHEIMTPRVSMICIQREATIQELRDLVIEEKHSRIPVYRERVDNIEGIIVAKDLMDYSDDRHKPDPITPLIRDTFFIPESMKVAELLKELQKRKQKMAIVVDEHGGVSGLVTMEDVMEEIVGEIQDEYDTDPSHFVEQGPQDFIVLGDAAVEELDERFGTDLEEDDYITVGGLITHNLGHLPEEGEGRHPVRDPGTRPTA